MRNKHPPLMCTLNAQSWALFWRFWFFWEVGPSCRKSVICLWRLNLLLVLACFSFCLSATVKIAWPLCSLGAALPRCPPPWWTESESQPIPPPLFFCSKALTCGSHEEKLSGMGPSPSSELPVHSQKYGDTRWPNIAFLQPGRRGPCPFDSWSCTSNFQEGEK